MCYTGFVHKSFYASGFLYNLKTQQILLLQSEKENTSDCNWSMLGGESKEGEEDAQLTFQRVVQERLNLSLKAKQIYPVYDYFHDQRDKINYVFYAEVNKTPNFAAQGGVLTWVTFTEILKFPFTVHTKQDVIVGERVINLKQRQVLGLQP